MIKSGYFYEEKKGGGKLIISPGPRRIYYPFHYGAKALKPLRAFFRQNESLRSALIPPDACHDL